MDLFFFFEDQGQWVNAVPARPVPIMWRYSRFSLEPFRYLQRDWFLPSPPERCLEEEYGPQWRTPDTEFDALLSARNLDERSWPACLMAAYGNLYDSVKARQWDKVMMYCRVLGRERPSDFLDRLAEWTRKASAG